MGTDVAAVRRIAAEATMTGLAMLQESGMLDPLVLLVRDGRTVAAVRVEFDDGPSSRERCYAGVAEVAGVLRAEGAVLLNDAVMNRASEVRPLDDPAATNCLVVTMLLRDCAATAVVPYQVADGGRIVPCLDLGAEISQMATMPWWSTQIATALADGPDGPPEGTGEKVETGLRAVMVRYSPHIRSVAVRG